MSLLADPINPLMLNWAFKKPGNIIIQNVIIDLDTETIFLVLSGRTLFPHLGICCSLEWI